MRAGAGSRQPRAGALCHHSWGTNGFPEVQALPLDTSYVAFEHIHALVALDQNLPSPLGLHCHALSQ